MWYEIYDQSSYLIKDTGDAIITPPTLGWYIVMVMCASDLVI